MSLIAFKSFEIDLRLLFLFRLLIGELDEAIDNAVDLSTVRAEPMAGIRW